ncbi:DUF533 domain-containing protein [Algirhabdus cladophorae]|uniref:DUF533 domain-containing protein n=1 Tax=Algirhabdus cladophorae TaxID=3377108 RepID=UPI003B84B5B7
MSLMGTLAKVAVGIAVAKGASAMMKGAQGAQSGQASAGGMFGGAHSPQTAQTGGGIEDMLGGMLGGGGGAAGGLGGLLEGLQGGGSGGASGGLDSLLGGLTGAGSAGQAGGLGGLLGGLTGSTGGTSGGLGGLLGGLAAAAGAGGAAGAASGGFGGMLNSALARGGEPEVPPSPEQEMGAALMLRAMIQAAKSDGQIDDAERAKIMDKLGDISPEEREFVNAELAAPVDPAALAGQTPAGLAPQIYAMSVLAIDLDNQNEAQYLHSLANAMGLDQASVNSIHDQFGVPKLYS